MKADIGIYYTIAVFILFESWTAAIDIYHEDLSKPYTLCPPKSSCENVNQTTEDLEVIDNVDVQRNCMCDDRCVVYGDCCTDHSHFDPVAQQSAAARYACIPTDTISGAYVVNRCPATWTNTSVRDACNATAIDAYSMLGNPVTSQTTGHSYKNRFCAMCNDDTANLTLWQTKIVCDSLLGVLDKFRPDVLNTLQYNAANGLWEVMFLGEKSNCKQTVVAPTRIRMCQPDTLVTCNPHWPNDENRSNCEAYTTLMYNYDQPYKNIHCAICNNVAVQNLTCEMSNLLKRFPSQFMERSFTELFVAQPGHRDCRDPNMYYDEISKTCQHLLTSRAGDGVPLDCSKRAIYSVSDKDWRIPKDKAKYVMLENGSIIVCVDTTAKTLGNVVLTYVGLGVSAVLLIAHLIVFAVLPEMKNLSGKNLASFCVSLLCSYAGFVVGNWLTGPACYVGAAFTYYAFITSFAWMLVMSFDCWRSLRLATVKLRITSSRQTKKFLLYSAVCWLVPAMMTFVAVVADFVPAVPDNVRPRFGRDQCWFGNKTALLLFFAGPLTIVMAVNIVLFGWTAYMIHSSRATVRHVNTRYARRDFRMYCRLGVFMGLTWSTGIVASYTDNNLMWIAFVFFNTFQGLFLFIAFTYRRHLLKSLLRSVSVKNLRHLSHEKNVDKHSRDPPPASITWSSNSAPISSEKTTDTLY